MDDTLSITSIISNNDDDGPQSHDEEEEMNLKEVLERQVKLEQALEVLNSPRLILSPEKKSSAIKLLIFFSKFSFGL